MSADSTWRREIMRMTGSVLPGRRSKRGVMAMELILYQFLMFAGGSAPPPANWQVDADSTMFQIIGQGPLPPDYDATDAVPLTAGCTARAVKLAAHPHELDA